MSSTFPLFDMPPASLEMVLRKTQSKTFRRLQQTSWEMWGFVQKNSKVSVFTEGEFVLELREEADSYSFYINKKHYMYYSVHLAKKIYRTEDANAKGLYASRLASLDISGLNSRLFQPICDFVQKYRITCDELILQCIDWRKEEYATILEILKPVSLELIKCRFNAYEGLYESPILKKLANYQQVTITVPNNIENKRDTSEQLWLFHRILQTLLSVPRPRLLRFTFFLDTVIMQLPTEDALRIELADFDLTDVYGDRNLVYGNVILPPEHYSLKSRLYLVLRSDRPRFSRWSALPAGDISYIKHFF